MKTMLQKHFNTPKRLIIFQLRTKMHMKIKLQNLIKQHKKVSGQKFNAAYKKFLALRTETHTKKYKLTDRILFTPIYAANFVLQILLNLLP